MTVAELFAYADDISRKISDLQQRVGAIVERRDGLARQWRDENCGREIAPSDPDYPALWPTPMNSRVPADVEEAAALFDAKILETTHRHDEVEALRARERTDQCGRALAADDPDASRLVAAVCVASVQKFRARVN